ncbi:hypothetical protein NP233_g12003 [Leucocoprinus birnbaumii]|uniref:Uncharacterized protein n=1 Tax=Leucocoprinus birnbaumii TaxID=56174 RepID=A0AAD5VF87_9AGAR|nr:hypothetical protein NP233_g12003 [Leucocoprinus birnbaumii]
MRALTTLSYIRAFCYRLLGAVAALQPSLIPGLVQLYLYQFSLFHSNQHAFHFHFFPSKQHPSPGNQTFPHTPSRRTATLRQLQ